MTVAQVTITKSDQIGTKWHISEDYDSQSSDYYEFSNKAVIWHRGDGTTFYYPFYLSTTIPTKFDFTKVGVNNKGCYYIEYSPKIDYFYCYAIMTFDKSKRKMIHKLMNQDVIGLSDTVTYTLKK